MRKIPFAGVELTSQRVRGLRGSSELPGRPAQYVFLFHTLRALFVQGKVISKSLLPLHPRLGCIALGAFVYGGCSI